MKTYYELSSEADIAQESEAIGLIQGARITEDGKKNLALQQFLISMEQKDEVCSEVTLELYRLLVQRLSIPPYSSADIDRSDSAIPADLDSLLVCKPRTKLKL